MSRFSAVRRSLAQKHSMDPRYVTKAARVTKATRQREPTGQQIARHRGATSTQPNTTHTHPERFESPDCQGHFVSLRGNASRHGCPSLHFSCVLSLSCLVEFHSLGYCLLSRKAWGYVITAKQLILVVRHLFFLLGASRITCEPFQQDGTV